MSFNVVLIYFCVLREENDIDDKLRHGTLYDHIEGLERRQLEICLKEYTRAGTDPSEIISRLEKLDEREKEEAAAAAAKAS
jgi:hypothetical protein